MTISLFRRTFNYFTALAQFLTAFYDNDILRRQSLLHSDTVALHVAQNDSVAKAFPSLTFHTKISPDALR